LLAWKRIWGARVGKRPIDRARLRKASPPGAEQPTTCYFTLPTQFKFLRRLPLMQTLSRARFCDPRFCDTVRKDLYQYIQTARFLSDAFYNSA
jgi:hypothetical protein